MSKAPVLQIPKPALELAGLFKRGGHGLWLVGGWVRDALLGNIHSDLDFATDAPPERSRTLLAEWSKAVWDTGIAFGTVGAERGGVRVEVTTFREEVYRDDSRKPAVKYGGDLETDLSRRDFTVNAMAIELPVGELVDPFGGSTDLDHRLLRTPRGPELSFSDDPLRMLRALRFMSTLEFRLDQEVVDGTASMHDRLRIVSAERIRDEFARLMLGPGASSALEVATDTGLADEFLPELLALKATTDPLHRHKDLFRHTLAVLENVITLQDTPDLVTRLAALFHDVGKPRTRRITDDDVSFHHHEVVGAAMAADRLKALRFPARVIAEVRELVFLHMRFHTYRLGWSDKAVRRYVRDAGALYPRLNSLVRADCTTRNPEKARRLSRRMDELEARIAELAASEELAAMRPALDGREVMDELDLGPGPAVGEALEFLMTIRMEEGEIPKDEARERLRKWWHERGSN